MEKSIPTNELIHRLRGLVSAAQLKRWRNADLFPEWCCKVVHHGRKGTETCWHSSTLERARLIANTLADGDPTMKRAAYVLLVEGFETRPSWIKALLLEVPDEITRGLGLWRDKAYLKKKFVSNASKIERLTDLVMRRMPGASDDVVELYVTLLSGIAGIPYATPDTPAARIAQYLSPTAIADTIEATPDDVLIRLFLQCRGFDQISVAYSWVLSILEPFNDDQTFNFLTPLTGRAFSTSCSKIEDLRLALLWRALFNQHGLALARDITDMVKSTVNEALRLNAAMPVGDPHESHAR